MNLKTLKTKNIIKEPTSLGDEKKFDLTSPSLVIVNEAKLKAYHHVSEYEVARLDLISLKYYGNTSYVDVICKANGISNPFAVAPGTILAIPDRDAVSYSFKKPKKIVNNPRDQFTEPKRASQKDKSRLEFLKDKSGTKKNGSKENLPPNMLKTGEKYKKMQANGTILLGANMKTTNNPKIKRK